MECLTDFVGIRGCGETVPGSGVYLNTLPGISLESLDKVADSEQITYKGLWADIQTEAGVRFYTDVIEELSKCFKLTPYCDYEELICQNKLRLLNAWRYLLGNQTMLFRLHSTRFNRFTTVDKKKAEELLDYYQAEYEKALQQAVKLMEVSSCELCCGGNPEYVTWLP